MEEKKISLYYLILVDGTSHSNFNLSQSEDIIPNAVMVVMVSMFMFTAL